MILLVIYLVTFATAFLLGLYDIKRQFGLVTIGDFMFISLLSIVPVGNIGVILAVLSGGVSRSGILSKKVF